MATRRFLYYSATANYTPTFRQQEVADTLTLGGLTMSGDVTISGGTAKVTGCTAASTSGDALVYGQASASLAGLTLGADLVMNSNKITGLPAIPSNDTDISSKNYLDNAVTGNMWQEPAVVLSILDSQGQSGVDPTAGGTGEAWLVDNWSTKNDGDIVEWSGAAWVTIVAASGSEPPDGTRVVVASASAAGAFAGKENNMAEYDATEDSWTFTAPSTGDAIMIVDDDSVYDGIGYVYNGSAWTQFTGTSLVTAGAGLNKSGNTLSVNAGNGVTIPADALELDLASSSGLTVGGSGLSVDLYDTNPCLQLAGNELSVIVDTDYALQLDASGVGINLDGSTLSFDSGLKVDGLPLQFYLGGSQVSADVIAANLDELTNDSITTLHTHTVSIATEAERCSRVMTVKEASGIAIGDAAYVSSAANGSVAVARADDDTKSWAVGVAITAGALDGNAEIVFYGPADGVITGATAGDAYYLAPTGGLTTTIPSSPNYATRVGFAVNATDLFVQPHFFGKL